jgi:hypothetical protein
LSDGISRDGIIGFSSIDILSRLSNISKDSAIAYNTILEKEKLLYIYRAKELKLMNDGTISGITNTYGRYKHKKLIIAEGNEHKEDYSYNKETDSIKHKTKKTTERKSLGAKYYNLVSGNKMYDEETIIEIYRYVVDYNKRHENDCYFEDKYKDEEFFEQFSFITKDCLKKTKRKLPIKQSTDDWGEPDPMEKDYSIEEILDMPTENEYTEEIYKIEFENQS